MHQPVELPDEPLIRFVRMKTGDDLLTELVQMKVNDQDCYLFVNPLKIVYVDGDKPGSLLLSLIEWVFPRISPKQQFQIYPEDVITVAEIGNEVTDYYFEALHKLDKSSVSRGEIVTSHTDIGTEDNSPPTDEEIEYLKKIIDDLKNGKRILH